jgi:hypothetical protein
VNLRATLDALETIQKMDFHVPRKPKKLVEKSRNRKGKRKVSFKEDGLTCKRKNSSKYCSLYAKHGRAKTITILGIVRNMRKKGSLKRLLNPRRGSPPSIKKITTSLLRQ